MGDFPETTPFGTDALISLTRGGVTESFPLPGGQRRWVTHVCRGLGHAPQPHDLTDLVARRTGLPVPDRECQMLSAFGVQRYLAPTMVQGRVALLGDAAHVVSPIGGQGTNLGWLDAAALAPLLGRAARRTGGLNAKWQCFGRTRRRAAWLGAQQAEINMGLGRPASAAGQVLREALVQGLLVPAVHPILAQAFTMRWLA